MLIAAVLLAAVLCARPTHAVSNAPDPTQDPRLDPVGVSDPAIIPTSSLSALFSLNGDGTNLDAMRLGYDHAATAAFGNGLELTRGRSAVVDEVRLQGTDVDGGARVSVTLDPSPNKDPGTGALHPLDAISGIATQGKGITANPGFADAVLQRKPMCYAQSFAVRVKVHPSGDWRWITTSGVASDEANIAAGDSDPNYNRAGKLRIFKVDAANVNTPQLHRFPPVHASEVAIFPLGENSPCIRFEVYRGNTLLLSPQNAQSSGVVAAGTGASESSTGDEARDGAGDLAVSTMGSGRFEISGGGLGVADNGCGFVEAELTCDNCDIVLPPVAASSEPGQFSKAYLAKFPVDTVGASSASAPAAFVASYTSSGHSGAAGGVPGIIPPNDDPNNSEGHYEPRNFHERGDHPSRVAAKGDTHRFSEPGSHKLISGPARDVDIALRGARFTVKRGAAGGADADGSWNGDGGARLKVVVRYAASRGDDTDGGLGVDRHAFERVVKEDVKKVCSRSCNYFYCYSWCRNDVTTIYDSSKARASYTDLEACREWGEFSPHPGVGHDNFNIWANGRLVINKDGVHKVSSRTDDGSLYRVFRPWLTEGIDASSAPTTGQSFLKANKWANQSPTHKQSSRSLKFRAGRAVDYEQYMFEAGGGATMESYLLAPPFDINADSTKFGPGNVRRCALHEEVATFSASPAANPPAAALPFVVQVTSPAATPLSVTEGGADLVVELRLSHAPAAGTTVLVGHESAVLESDPPVVAFTGADFATPKTVTIRAPAQDTRRGPAEVAVPVASVSCRGHGADGPLTVINSVAEVGTYAAITDAVTAPGATSINVDDTTGFAAGDEVMVYQTQHETSPGMYEFATVAAVAANRIDLDAAAGLSREYHSASASRSAQVVRVQQYTTVRVGFLGVLTCGAWNSATRKGGVLAIRAQGSFVTEFGGVVDVSARGFAGGGCGNCGDLDAGIQGESHCGLGADSRLPNCNGGGGGDGANGISGSPGGAGGNAGPGSLGEGTNGAVAPDGYGVGARVSARPALGGRACAAPPASAGPAAGLAFACLGGGGGGGGDNDNASPLPVGGAGGGFFYAYAREWSPLASIRARGGPSVWAGVTSSAPSGPGGGGTVVLGGAVLPEAGLNVTGGNAGTEHTSSVNGDDWVGRGGNGRVQLLGPGDCVAHGAAAPAAGAPEVVVVEDDPAVSLIVAPAIPSTLDEGGVYVRAVTLSGPPSAGSVHTLRVDINITQDLLPVIVDPPHLFFSAEDWSVPHTFTLDVTDDEIVPAEAITGSVLIQGHSAADAEVLAAPIEVQVSLGNNDLAGVRTTFSTRDEPKTSTAVTYVSVALLSRPTESVTVTLAPFEDSLHIVHPDGGDGDKTKVTFSTTNWATDKALTFSIKNDAVNKPSPYTIDGLFLFDTNDPEYKIIANSTATIASVRDNDLGDLLAPTGVTTQVFFSGKPLIDITNNIAGQPTDLVVSFRHYSSYEVAADAVFRLEMPIGYEMIVGTTAAVVEAGIDGTLTVSQDVGTRLTGSEGSTPAARLLAAERASMTGNTLVIARQGVTTAHASSAVIRFRVTGVRLPLAVGARSAVKDASDLDTFALYITRGTDATYISHNIDDCRVRGPDLSSLEKAIPILPDLIVSRQLSERGLRDGTQTLDISVRGAVFREDASLSAQMVLGILSTIRGTETLDAGGWNRLTSGMFGDGSAVPKRSLNKERTILSITLPMLPDYGTATNVEGITFDMGRDAFQDPSDYHSVSDTVPELVSCTPSAAAGGACARVLRSFFARVPDSAPLVVSTPPTAGTIVVSTLRIATVFAVVSEAASSLASASIPAPDAALIGVSEASVSATAQSVGALTLEINPKPGSPEADQFAVGETVSAFTRDEVTSNLPASIRSKELITVVLSLGVPATVRMMVTTSLPVTFTEIDEPTPLPAMLFVSSNTRSISFIPVQAGHLTFTLTPASGRGGGKDAAQYRQANFTTLVVESFSSNLPARMPIESTINLVVSLTAPAHMNVSVVLTGAADIVSLTGGNATQSSVYEIIGESEITLPIFSSTFGDVKVDVTAVSGPDAGVFVPASFSSRVSVPSTLVIPEMLFIGEPVSDATLTSARPGEVVFSIDPRTDAARDLDVSFNATVNNFTSVAAALAAGSGSSGWPLNVSLVPDIHTDARLTLGITPRGCGPVEIAAVPVGGADYDLYAEVAAFSHAYVAGRPSSATAQLLRVTSGSIPLGGNASFAVDAAPVDLFGGGGFDIVLPAGVEEVSIDPVFDVAVCRVSVGGTDLLREPQHNFSVPLLHPLTLTVDFTAGDDTSTSSFNVTLRRDCEPGYRITSAGSGYCLPCPRHSFTTGVNVEECTECETGSYTADVGGVTCLDCQFSSTLGGPYPKPELIKTGLGARSSYAAEDTELLLRGLVTLISPFSSYPYDNLYSMALSYRVTLSATHGTLDVATSEDPLNDIELQTGATGLSVIVFLGTEATINEFFASSRLTFNPDADFHGVAEFTVAVDDIDGVGCSAQSVSTQVITIIVDAVNDDPVLTVASPAPVGGSGGGNTTTTTGATTAVVDEDSEVSLTGWIVITDVDMATAPSGQGSYRVTLSAQDGVVSMSDLAGVTVEGGASMERQITFSGPVAAVDRVLAADLKYIPDADFNGGASVTIIVSDMGGYPSPPRETSHVLPITVNAVNDVQTIQGAFAGSYAGSEDKMLVLNGLAVNDIDQPSTSPLPLRVRMTVSRGTLGLGSSIGLTQHGSGGAVDVSLDFVTAFDFDAPTLQTVNDALRGLRYSPEANFVGTVRLTLIVTDRTYGEDSDAMMATYGADLLISDVDDLTVIEVKGSTLASDAVLLVAGREVELAPIFFEDVESASTPGGFTMDVQITSGTLRLNRTVNFFDVDIPSAQYDPSARLFAKGSLDTLNRMLMSLHYSNTFADERTAIVTVATYPSANPSAKVERRWRFSTCSEGEFLDTTFGSCRSCLPGTYSAVKGLAECAPCPVGYAQGQLGMSSCTRCELGHEALFEGSSRCTKCRPGSFRASNDDLSCALCEEGSFAGEEGSTSCEQCRPGTFNSINGSVACTSCIAGYYSLGGKGDCVPCSPGTYASAKEASLCVECPIGWYQPEQGRSKCLECPADTFNDVPGADRCKPCSTAGKNTRGRVGSPSEDSCECATGTFGDPGPGVCTSCPKGGKCVDGASNPDVVPGFWTDTPNATQFFQCIPSHACLGTTNSSFGDGCAKGYTGFRCGECEVAPQRYYRVGDECIICPESTGWSMVVLFVLFCIVAGLLMVFGKAGVRFGTVQIGINFFQMLSLFSGFRLNWPPVVVEFFSWMGIFSFNVEVMHPECEVQMSYFQKTLMILSLPFFFLALFLTVFAMYVSYDKVSFVARMRRENIEEDSVEFRDASIRRRERVRRMMFLCIASFMILLSILYAALTTRSLQFFDCTLQHDGRYLMDASPTDECFKDDWYKFLWVGVFGTAIYVIAYPVILATCVSRAKMDKHVRDIVMQIFSPLLSNYRGKYLGWELAIIARKAVIITATLYFTESAMYQTIGGLIVLIFALVAHSHGKPFIDMPNNVAEFVSLLCALLILLFGLVVFPGQPTEEEYNHIGAIVIGLAVIAMVVLIGSAMHEAVGAWTTLRRAVDFRKYTNDENILCLRRVIAPACESRVRDWLQFSYEGHREGLHENLWSLLRELSVSVMKFNAEKAAVKGSPATGDLAQTTSMSEAALRLRQLLFSRRSAQAHLTSTHVLASFCGGMLQESVVPPVREWVRTRAAQIERGTATNKDVTDLQNFVVTFTSIELHCFRQREGTKDLWHEEQEAKTAAARAFRILEHEAEDAGDADDDGDDDGAALHGTQSSSRASVVDLAPVDRAVTALVVPLLYGPFGASWLATMHNITQSDELSSLSLYRQTLYDLQKAYLCQLNVNGEYTPSMRFSASLPRKYRVVVAESAITANDNWSEEEEEDESPAGAKRGRRKSVHGSKSTPKLNTQNVADVLASIDEADTGSRDLPDDEGGATGDDANTMVSIMGVGINIPSWPFFGGPTRTPALLPNMTASDEDDGVFSDREHDEEDILSDR